MAAVQKSHSSNTKTPVQSQVWTCDIHRCTRQIYHVKAPFTRLPCWTSPQCLDTCLGIPDLLHLHSQHLTNFKPMLAGEY